MRGLRYALGMKELEAARGWVRAIALLVLLVGNSAEVRAAGSGWARPGQEAGSEFVTFGEALVGERVSALVVQGLRIGWEVERVRIEGDVGARRLVREIQSRIQAEAYGESMDHESKATRVFELEERGALVSYEIWQSENGVVETDWLAFRDGVWTHVNKRGERETVRGLDGFDFTLGEEIAVSNWLSGAPEVGSQVGYRELDLADESGTSRIELTLEAIEERPEGTRFLVHSFQDGLEAEMCLDCLGRIDRAATGGFVIELAEASILDDPLDGSINFSDLVLVPLDQTLGDPKSVDYLRIEFEGFGEFEIPEDGRQRIVSRDGSKAVVEIARVDRDSARVELTEEEYDKYLNPDLRVTSEHPEILALAQKIAGRKASPENRARRLQRWIHLRMKYTAAANVDKAIEVLDQMKGDCTEHSLLLCAFCRAAGIPAREVGGLAYAGDDPPSLGWHAWVEIHDDERWITMDPTWGQRVVDATHIKFDEDPDDASYLNLMGELKGKVLEVRRADEKP